MTCCWEGSCRPSQDKVTELHLLLPCRAVTEADGVQHIYCDANDTQDVSEGVPPCWTLPHQGL
jgi:hypothetical protein